MIGKTYVMSTGNDIEDAATENRNGYSTIGMNAGEVDVLRNSEHGEFVPLPVYDAVARLQMPSVSLEISSSSVQTSMGVTQDLSECRLSGDDDDTHERQKRHKTNNHAKECVSTIRSGSLFVKRATKSINLRENLNCQTGCEIECNIDNNSSFACNRKHLMFNFHRLRRDFTSPRLLESERFGVSARNYHQQSLLNSSRMIDCKEYFRYGKIDSIRNDFRNENLEQNVNVSRTTTKPENERNFDFVFRPSRTLVFQNIFGLPYFGENGKSELEGGGRGRKIGSFRHPNQVFCVALSCSDDDCYHSTNFVPSSGRSSYNTSQNSDVLATACQDGYIRFQKITASLLSDKAQGTNDNENETLQRERDDGLSQSRVSMQRRGAWNDIRADGSCDDIGDNVTVLRTNRVGWAILDMKFCNNCRTDSSPSKLFYSSWDRNVMMIHLDADCMPIDDRQQTVVAQYIFVLSFIFVTLLEMEAVFSPVWKTTTMNCTKFSLLFCCWIFRHWI